MQPANHHQHGGTSNGDGSASPGHALTKGMTIAELGRRSGVGSETVRYYFRIGLLRGAMPSPHGPRRRYGEEALAELQFVRRCKALGFRLREIAVLVQLRASGAGSCGALHESLRELRGRLDAEKAEIEARLASVASLLGACDGKSSPSACGAFAALEATNGVP